MIRIPTRPQTSAAGTGRGLLSRAAAAPSTRGLIRVRSALDSVPEARRLDARPFQEADAAVGNIGQAITSGAELIARTGERLRQAEDMATLAEVDRKSTEEKTAFQVGLLEKDPLTWGDEFKKFSADQNSRLLTADMPAHVRARAANNLARDHNALALDTMKTSVMARTAQAREKVVTAYGAALKTGDTEKAVGLIEATPNHLIDPAAKERMLRDAPRMAEAARIDTLLSTNPSQAKALLEDVGEDGRPKAFQHTDPEDARRYASQADSMEREKQADSLDTMMGKIESGEIKDDGQIEIEAAGLSERQRMGLKGMLSRRDSAVHKAKIREDAPQNFARLSDAAEAYDMKTDPTGERYAQLVMSIREYLPEELRGEITKPLYAKRTGAGNFDAPDGLKSTVRDITDTMFKAGGFGKFMESKPPKEGETEWGWGENPKLRVEAEKEKGRVMIYMGKWMKENAQASPEQAHKAMREFMSGSAPSLRSSAPAPAPTFRRMPPAEPVLPQSAGNGPENDLPDSGPSAGGDFDLIPFLPGEYIPTEK